MKFGQSRDQKLKVKSRELWEDSFTHYFFSTLNFYMHLVLFFTRSVSLKRWADNGAFGRETALYRKMQPHLEQITFVTYGGAGDLEFADQLPGIKILCNQWNLPKRLYALLLPFLFFRQLRTADLFKTNQIHGADVALWARLIHQKPLIVRAGYMWPRDHEREVGKSWQTRLMHKIAQRALHKANQIVFTTAGMKAFAVEQYQVDPQKIAIVPNYVDTALFKPLPDVEKVAGRVVAIGRLHERKNLNLLIQAVAQLPNIHLVLIGDGPAKQELEELANRLNVPVEFMGALPNEVLPEQIGKAEIYTLVSKFEGHPKALIEAMGCGATVVGSHVEGIINVINDNVNGRLCQPTVESIRHVLSELSDNPTERKKIGEKAHLFVLENYAIEQIVQSELGIYRSIVGGVDAA